MLGMPLLKSQKNEILELIESFYLNPSNFKWSVVRSVNDSKVEVHRIDYVSTEFFFQFDIDRKDHRYSIYSPGEDKILDDKSSFSWDAQKEYFRNWLSYLCKEIRQPDLWAKISEYRLPPGSEVEPDISNEPFNEDQIAQILSGLNQISAYIEQKTSVSDDQNKFVKEYLDYLVDAVRRQGRKDWIHMCIGVLSLIVALLNLSPEQSQTIWNLLKTAVSGIRFLPR